MKKIIIFIIMLFVACSVASSQYFRSSPPAKWRYSDNYHEDTDRITFSVNGRLMYFTYHYCGGMYAGKLFTTRNNGKIQLLRMHIVLATDPAEMSPEELWRAL